jgi:hypothetical protein
MLAIFLVEGVRTQKNGLRTHLSKVSDGNAPKISHEQVRAVQIRAPRSTTHIEFWTPPAFLPLSGGGGGWGGPESGAHLSNGPDQRARINGDKGHSGPPPAFLPLSGGGGSGIADATFRRPRF